MKTEREIYSGAVSANNSDGLQLGPLVPQGSSLARGKKKGFLQGRVSELYDSQVKSCPRLIVVSFAGTQWHAFVYIVSTIS